MKEEKVIVTTSDLTLGKVCGLWFPGVSGSLGPRDPLPPPSPLAPGCAAVPLAESPARLGHRLPTPALSSGLERSLPNISIITGQGLRAHRLRFHLEVCFCPFPSVLSRHLLLHVFVCLSPSFCLSVSASVTFPASALFVLAFVLSWLRSLSLPDSVSPWLCLLAFIPTPPAKSAYFPLILQGLLPGL